MSDLDNRNAAATRKALENYDIEIEKMRKRLTVMENNIGTLSNLMGELMQSNNLALAKLRGHGPT